MAMRKREDEELVCPAELEAKETPALSRGSQSWSAWCSRASDHDAVIRALRARNYSLSAASFRASDILGWIVRNSKIITGYGGRLWQLNEV